MRAKRVYFLRPIGQLGPVKIGCSVFPEGRLDSFTIWSPVKLELITSVPGTHADEKALHGMFREHHLHGEWFGASKELLALIDRCAATGALPELPRVIKFPKVRHEAHTAKKPAPLDRKAWAVRIRAEYECGDTAAELAARHGICHHTVLRMIRMAGGKVASRGRPRGPDDADRAADMAKRYMRGETLKQIGDHYEISRERVRQVLESIGVERRGKGCRGFRRRFAA